MTAGRVGPKTPVASRTAVASSQHPIVTNTMLDVMRKGGNAVDAAIAGCLVQATVQQDMTNHAGTVCFLYWEASTGKTYELNSSGTVVPDLPPLRRVPPGHGLYADGMAPMAVIPGFMPAMKELHGRFATKAWRELCEPAVRWAEDGHAVNSFEHLVMAQTVDFFLYTPSGRAHFTPGGFLPQVGDVWASPELARTIAKLAEEGPDHFITGEWASHFVERANELGWSITLSHMTATPPRWGEGTRWKHRGYEIVQPSPPERQAVYCSLVLGILDELEITSLGHYTESPEALYYFGHALRRASYECGMLNDPHVFEDPTETLMAPDLRRLIARLLRTSKPRADMTKHVELTAGPLAMAAAGASPKPPTQPAGSCELSIVDPQGNWVQMMNTLQSGGIPGEVVDGVPMVGSHAMTNLQAPIAAWLTGGGRMRSVMSNTIVFKDGRPVVSLGSPGNVHCTVPQVLSNILDYGMDPYEAEDAPRMNPLTDDYRLGIESRLRPDMVDGLAKLGLSVDPLPAYDYHMGSYQMSWRDADGTLHGAVGPRRSGEPGAL